MREMLTMSHVCCVGAAWLSPARSQPAHKGTIQTGSENPTKSCGGAEMAKGTSEAPWMAQLPAHTPKL